MILITIITVCYNSERYIEKTIDSVINQSYPYIEYILVDGVSSDSTLSIIERYAHKYPKIVKYISEPDTGIYNAMNKGIQMASGEVIGIINSDDWYEIDAVNEIVKSYLVHGCAIYHGIQRTFSKEMVINLVATSSSQLESRMIEHPTCFVPKKIYQEFGKFKDTYKYVGDYEFMLRLYRENIPFILIEKVIANFRLGGVSYSPKAIWENYKLWLDLGLMSKKEYVYRSLMDRLKFLVR